MNKPEILAPGSSAGAVYAALRAGCDAIYIGGKRFGARAFADNPEMDELAELMDHVHMHGKKMYLTVNTVLCDGEFDALYEYMKQVYEHGIDAVIVQDMGVLRFIHNEFPNLPIHASTQMSVLRAEAVNILKGYGVTRVVPARELTLSEIGEIDKGTDAEIEVFVHGALCCSMSGQCLMSSLIGGRSGNRGACAQPCRKLYSYNKKKEEYYLSLKDLCALPLIPELIKNGVESFKIEGRMKKPEYVSHATYMYRKYTDIYYEKGYDAYVNEVLHSDEYRKDYISLMDIYNRGGFTSGYLVDRKVSDDIFASDRPGHAGVRVGSMRGNSVIRIENEVYPHDVLEIRDESGGAVHEHTLKEGLCAGEIRIRAGYNSDKIKNGYNVFRIRNNSLIDSINDRFRPLMPPVYITGRFCAENGQNMSLTLGFGSVSVTVYGSICDRALSHPAVKEDIVKKIKVSGDSIYEWDGLDVVMDDGLFISAKELKELRREGFKSLYEETVRTFRREKKRRQLPDAQIKCNVKDGATELIAECRTNEQFDVINREPCIDTVYVHVEDYGKEELCGFERLLEQSCKSVYIVLPRVARAGVLETFDRCFDWTGLFKRNECLKGYVVSSLEEIDYVNGIAESMRNKNYTESMEIMESMGRERYIGIRTADNMYVRNRHTYACLTELGAEHVSLSVEMADREYAPFAGMCADVLIYGRVTAMVMMNHHGAAGRLKDGYGNEYKVVYHNNTGYTEILNYEVRNLIDSAGCYTGLSKRIRFTDESAEKVRSVLGRCVNI